jgi:hypothetical protein
VFLDSEVHCCVVSESNMGHVIMIHVLVIYIYVTDIYLHIINNSNVLYCVCVDVVLYMTFLVFLKELLLFRYFCESKCVLVT